MVSACSNRPTRKGMRWSTDGNSITTRRWATLNKPVYRVRLGRALPEKVLGFGRMLSFDGVGNVISRYCAHGSVTRDASNVSARRREDVFPCKEALTGSLEAPTSAAAI